MQLLTSLLSRDFLNLESSTDNSTGQNNLGMAADVFFYGLNIVMPLMTIDMLKFPSLCLQ